MRIVNRLFGALLVAFLVLCVPRVALGGEKLRVLVPDRGNLQYMSFWVAKAGGFFARESIDVELVVAPAPTRTEALFEHGDAEAAVLPAPMYLRLVAARRPVVLVASLLRNDPIDVVVRREVLEARALSREMPLRDRVLGLRGLRIGVAPHPPPRLRALLATQGLTERDIEMVVLRGREQNEAFANKEVDALYAHTPFLERAVVHDDGVVLIEQAGGEVKELANRLVHGFVVRKDVQVGRPSLVLAAVRAIEAAEKSIHAAQKPTVDALAREFPARDRRELETIVALYERAIPERADVSIADLAPALAFFPQGEALPDLSGIELAPFVATSVAGAARADDGGRRARWIALAAGALVVAGVLLALRQSRPRSA